MLAPWTTRAALGRGAQGAHDSGSDRRRGGRVRAGSNPFIPVTPEQLDVELRLLFVHPPTLDDAAKAAVVRNYATDNLHYVQVWNIVDLYRDVLLLHPPATLPGVTRIAVLGDPQAPGSVPQ